MKKLLTYIWAVPTAIVLSLFLTLSVFGNIYILIGVILGTFYIFNVTYFILAMIFTFLMWYVLFKLLKLTIKEMKKQK